MLIYISYFTLLLTTIVIAFEISHLHAPTVIDSTENMNNNNNNSNNIHNIHNNPNNSNSENVDFTTISDDLIYLETKRHQLILPIKPPPTQTTQPEIDEESIEFVTVKNTKIKLDEENVEIKLTSQFVVNPKIGINNRNTDDDSLVIATNYDDGRRLKSLLIDDSSSQSEEEDCNSSEEEHSNHHIYRPNIDLSDFLNLIPVIQVQLIIKEYYENDKEIQHVYKYLKSQNFIELKQEILHITEVNDFLIYLNQSGFDVLNLIKVLTNLFDYPGNSNDEGGLMPLENNKEEMKNATTVMGGLHGLVDSILDILPQDQILSMFFEKLETDVEFSKFVQNIGNNMFSLLLKRIENSIPLRNLVYTLHNNGIFIARIVDSLKDYFFLGF